MENAAFELDFEVWGGSGQVEMLREGGPGGGTPGAKAQQLENTRCFNLPVKERVCGAAEEGRCGKEKGLRTSCRPGVDRVCVRSSPESDSIRCVLPCPGGGSGYKQWGRRGVLWGARPTIPSTTIPARSCPQGPQLWWAWPLEDAP